MEKIETRNGDSYLVSDPGDDYVLDEVYKTDEWGMNSYRTIIQLGMKILDIGANKGIFSIWAARRGAVVTSFEPNPITFSYFKKNIDLNLITDEIIAVNAGIWSKSGSEIFYPNNWNSGGSTFFPRVTNQHTSEPIKVPVECFDSVLDNKEWDVVKVDTEGAEYEIILSSNKLDQIKFLTMECHYWNETGGNSKYQNSNRPESSVELFNKMFNKLSSYFEMPDIKHQNEYPHGIMLYLNRR